MKKSLMVIGLSILLAGCNLSVSQENQVPTVTPEITKTQEAETSNTNLPKENTTMKQYQSAPTMIIDKSKTYTATMETTKGTMTFNLLAKETPVAVNNFVFLSREGFYTNTKFHRIMSGFMIQGGDPLGSGMGGPGYKFNDEPITREYKKGTLAMANSGPNTNGSQFFIMHKDYPLPKNYVIFGEIINGLDVLDAIASTPVVNNEMGEPSKPTEDVLIKSIMIEEK
jgi:cyclophilin family peptidyl-prolyl cis-trans isomerase